LKNYAPKKCKTSVKYIQSLELFDGMTKEGNVKGRKLLEEAIALDPTYPRLYMGLAITHFMDVWFGTTESPDRSLTQAFELAQKSISLDNSKSTANAYSLLGAIWGMRRQYDRAIADCELAVSLDPNSAENSVWLGTVLTWAGRATEAVRYLEYGIRLNPWPPASCFNNLAVAYRDSGQYEKAIEAAKKALQREPNNQFPHIHMAISYLRLGREEEAQAAAAEVLRVNPKFSLERYAKMLPFTKPVADRIVEDLRRAGLR
jgi:adenylate cyclase